MSVLGKVNKLIELALRDSTTDEARNAAIQACRLIREHDLLPGHVEEGQHSATEARPGGVESPIDQASRFLGNVLGGVMEYHVEAAKRRRTRGRR